VFDLLNTVIAFPGARLVRRPAYIRGKRNIRWGAGFTTGVGTRLDVFCEDASPRLIFGKGVQLNDHVHIGVMERVEIGHHVLIASRVFISDHNHGNYKEPDSRSSPSVPPQQRPVVAKPGSASRYAYWLASPLVRARLLEPARSLPEMCRPIPSWRATPPA